MAVVRDAVSHTTLLPLKAPVAASRSVILSSIVVESMSIFPDTPSPFVADMSPVVVTDLVINVFPSHDRSEF